MKQVWPMALGVVAGVGLFGGWLAWELWREYRRK